MRTTMHDFLTKGSSDFSIELFERRGFRELAREALDKAERWEERKCPLGALFVTWIVVALTLHRTKSYPHILTAMLGLMREAEPELALGYHERWETELSFDEIKTHLATVTHGTLHTTLRSKTPEGVLQEAHGMMIAYNLIRDVIAEAAETRDIPAREISFVEALEVVKEALPRFERAVHTQAPQQERERLVHQLLDDIAAVRLDRPRRKRVYDRAVKVKMSNFKLKRPQHGQQLRDFPAELRMGGCRAPDQDLPP